MDTKRNIIRLIAAALAVLFVVPLSGCIKPRHIVTESKWDGVFCYELYDDGTASIIAYSGSDEILRLPEEYNGRTITGMGIKTFEDCDTLREVYLPAKLTSIPPKLFENCGNLIKVYIPHTVKSIGKNILLGCPNFTTVLYGGTPAGWELIDMGLVPWSDNYTLVSAEIIYNQSGVD